MKYDSTYDEVMGEFFSGRLTIENSESKLVELGHGMGVGNRYGSYQQYTKKLSERKENGLIYIGKDIKIDDDTLSIVDPTTEFIVGDVPKVLIMFHNIINETSVKTIWKDLYDTTISEQYYTIPSPYSKQYAWWDWYGAYFIGPENLDEGYYKIDIISHIIGIKDLHSTLSTTIEFSVQNNEY